MGRVWIRRKRARQPRGKGVARGMQGGGNRNEGKMKEVGLRVLAGLEVKVGKEVEWWLGAKLGIRGTKQKYKRREMGKWTGT